MDVSLAARGANSGPLGLICAGVATGMLGLINVGWFGFDSLGLVAVAGFIVGGLGQVFAGFMEYQRGDSFGTTAFTGYGVFWCSQGAYLLLPRSAHAPEAFLGWYVFFWGLFSVCLLLATLRHPRLVQVFFAAVSATFLLGAISTWMHSTVLRVAGGCAGLFVTLCCFYLMTAALVNEALGHEWLPIGSVAQSSSSQ